MPSLWTVATLVYVVGVVSGLVLGDARPLPRVVLAVLWPLGPLAFLVTITILVGATAIAFPLVGVPLVMVMAAICWMLS